MSFAAGDAPEGRYFWQDEGRGARFCGRCRLFAAGVALLTLAACESRYAVTDEGVLARRISEDFAIGTPAADLVDALVAVGYIERNGPVRAGPHALHNCLSRHIEARLLPAASRTIHVCYAADDRGNLTAFEVSTTPANI